MGCHGNVLTVSLQKIFEPFYFLLDSCYCHSVVSMFSLKNFLFENFSLKVLNIFSATCGPFSNTIHILTEVLSVKNAALGSTATTATKTPQICI